MYVILGCGRVGARAAELLQEAGKEVLLLDKDATRVESLRERKFNVVEADMLGVDYTAKPYLDAEAFLLMSGSDDLNVQAVQLIREKLSKVRLLVRAGTPAAVAHLKQEGVQFVVSGPETVASAVFKELTELELFKRTDDLLRLIKAAGEGGLCIILHNSPDPDSIAAAMALQKVAEKVKVKSFIYYGGRVGHQQNRTMVNLLGVKMRQITPSDDVREVLRRHGKIAIVDCELAGQNNFLPRDVVPHIVIGHHITAGTRIPGEFVDVRQNVGAVSTILLMYLQELGLIPDPKLAAGLLHGIRVDTAGLTRHTSPSDLKSVAYLSPLVDQKLLEQIEAPPMTNDTVDVMGRAINNRVQRGAYLVSNCGFISDRDALAQAADFLLNLEGVTTVLCFGIQTDFVHLSSRSRDTRINLGDILQKAFGEQNAGGHAQAAGGQVPLGLLGGTEDREELLRLVEKAVAKRFFRAVGLPEEPPAAAVPANGAPSVPETPRPPLPSRAPARPKRNRQAKSRRH